MDIIELLKLEEKHSHHDCELTDFACGFKAGHEECESHWGMKLWESQIYTCQIREQTRHDTLEEVRNMMIREFVNSERMVKVLWEEINEELKILKYTEAGK